MKKNNTLFKTIVILFIVFSIMSWIIPAGKASGAEITSLGLSRISLYNLIEYPYLCLKFFIEPILYILVVGGFYGVLSKTGKYRNALEKIAKSLKGKETIFLVAVAFILAALNSVFGFNVILFAFIPALCGIILLMGYDKITAFLVTFISTLIGTIGNTYAFNTVGYINQIVGTELTTKMLIAKLALFLLTFVVYMAFTLSHAKKTKTANAEIADEYFFVGEKKQSKKPSWPIFVITGILLVIMILGYTDWSRMFKVTFFTDLHTTVTKWAIKDHTIVAYLIDGLEEFGSWAIPEFTVMILIATLLIKLVYNINIDDVIESFGEGAKKMLKPAFLVAVAYVLVLVTGYKPFIVTIADFICNTCGNGLANLINVTFIGKIIYVIFSTITLILTSVMDVEMLYVVQSTVPYMASLYADNINSLALLVQSIYGLTMFIAPTSTMMILGLETLNIPYKEWLKKSWKLVLELLAVIIVIILIVIFVLYK